MSEHFDGASPVLMEGAPASVRRFVGVCCLAAPLLLLTSMILRPPRSRTESEQLAAIADDRTAWLVTHLLIFAFAPLFIVAVAGLAWVAMRKSPVLTTAGLLLALVGLTGMSGHAALDIAAYHMTDPGRDSQQMTALLESLFGDAEAFILYSLVPLLLLAPGMLLISWGVARSGAVGVGIPALIGLGTLLFAIHWPTASAILAIGGSMLITVGLGAIAKKLLSPESAMRTS